MQVLKKGLCCCAIFLKKGGELLNCTKVCKGGSFWVLGFGCFVLLDLQLMVVSSISSLSI